MTRENKKRHHLIWIANASILIMCFAIANYVLMNTGRISKATSPTAQVIITPTLIPMENSISEWIRLLTPPNNCLLPCWWNITPGKTTLDETWDLWSNRFETARFVEFQKQYYVHVSGTFPNTGTHGFNYIIYVNAYAPERNTVDTIHMTVDFYDGTLGEKAWTYFSIDNIVEIYGLPSEVYVGIQPELFADIEAQWGINGLDLVDRIHLYWKNYGFAIFYYRWLGTGNGLAPFTTTSRCFTLENLISLSVWLKDPDDTRSFREFTGEINSPVTTVTLLTNEEFMHILLDNNLCIPDDLPIIESEEK